MRTIAVLAAASAAILLLVWALLCDKTDQDFAVAGIPVLPGSARIVDRYKGGGHPLCLFVKVDIPAGDKADYKAEVAAWSARWQGAHLKIPAEMYFSDVYDKADARKCYGIPKRDGKAVEWWDVMHVKAGDLYDTNHGRASSSKIVFDDESNLVYVVWVMF